MSRSAPNISRGDYARRTCLEEKRHPPAALRDLRSSTNRTSDAFNASLPISLGSTP